MLVFEILFWVSIFLVIYPYVLYDYLLKFLLSISAKKASADYYNNDWPELTFFISAHNEEEIICRKLDNTLSLDYSKDKMEIIVISDASDDRTDEIVRNKAKLDNRVKLIRQEGRKGKTAGINSAVQNSRGEIFIFSDANAMYRKNALVELVKCFNNSEVGYVVGAAVYKRNEESLAGLSENTYWNKELSLKQMESDYYSVVGGDGAIYAIRKKLFWPLQDDDINDFANPIQIIGNGYKGVFNSKAICYEDPANDFTKEYRRKRRIVNRSYRAFSKYISNLDFKHHKKFIFMLISHKVLRWFSLLFILAFTLSSFVLTINDKGFIYIVGLIGVLISGFLALIGCRLRLSPSCPRLLYLSYYFYLVNIAAMQGIIDNFRGRYNVTWDHIRKI